VWATYRGIAMGEDGGGKGEAIHDPSIDHEGRVSQPGRRDQVIGLISICRTAGLLLTIHDLISSSLPIVVVRCFFTLPVPSPSFLSLPSPSGTFRSRLTNVLLPSGLFCTLPTCSR
jgi:hypothetical protein